MNLYELLRQNKHRGLSTNLIRVILVQILDCLSMLWEVPSGSGLAAKVKLSTLVGPRDGINAGDTC